MRVGIWSFHFHPEPTGIGPVSRVLADGLAGRGHEVWVVAAHPHYPEPIWPARSFPYRERHGDVRVLRLPLWVGRRTATERYRQELSFVGALALAAPTLPKPDVQIAVSPSFLALLPAMLNARARRLPWVLWLQDILPDGAASAGIVDEDSLVMRQSRRLELAAYRSASRIVAISEAFVENLAAKGVPRQRIDLLYNPATRVPRLPAEPAVPPRILSMGNVGRSQGLAPLVAAFERSEAIRELGVELVIAGSGVALDDVRAEIRSDRVRVRGVVDDERLERELRGATIALVSQRHHGAEFNFPSKLMNFMTYGLPILAVVDPGSEVARVVNLAGAGWVVDSSEPAAFPAAVAEILRHPDELATRGAAARSFAAENFSQAGFSARFEQILTQVRNPTPTAAGM